MGWNVSHIASGSRFATLAKQENAICTAELAFGRKTSRYILPGQATTPERSLAESSISRNASKRSPSAVLLDQQFRSFGVQLPLRAPNDPIFGFPKSCGAQSALLVT